MPIFVFKFPRVLNSFTNLKGYIKKNYSPPNKKRVELVVENGPTVPIAIDSTQLPSIFIFARVYDTWLSRCTHAYFISTQVIMYEDGLVWVLKGH